jgi:hypothetical protein
MKQVCLLWEEMRPNPEKMFQEEESHYLLSAVHQEVDSTNRRTRKAKIANRPKWSGLLFRAFSRPRHAHTGV